MQGKSGRPRSDRGRPREGKGKSELTFDDLEELLGGAGTGGDRPSASATPPPTAYQAPPAQPSPPAAMQAQPVVLQPAQTRPQAPPPRPPARRRAPEPTIEPLSPPQLGTLSKTRASRAERTGESRQVRRRSRRKTAVEAKEILEHAAPTTLGLPGGLSPLQAAFVFSEIFGKPGGRFPD